MDFHNQLQDDLVTAMKARDEGNANYTAFYKDLITIDE